MKILTVKKLWWFSFLVWWISIQKRIFKGTPREKTLNGIVFKLIPNRNKSWYKERTGRNEGWGTEQEQKTLHDDTVVAVAGCGGIGGNGTVNLLRLGVGEIRLADCEKFDVSNINRQAAATRRTVGKSKAIETAKLLRRIADDTTIWVYPQGITEETVAHFVSGVDIILDEIEFWAVGARILLHQYMRKLGGCLLNSPTVGHRVYVFKFTPESMTIEEVLGITYEEACILQERIQKGSATESEIDRVKSAMLKFAVPEMPEYSANLELFSTALAFKKRLDTTNEVSIIATNPPMATGFLVSQAYFEIITKKSTTKRNFVTVPPMPGYIMMDVAHLTTKIVTIPWWTHQIRA
jgi:molybdopterin/thiamine biosynthesis adenylyltransferase